MVLLLDRVHGQLCKLLTPRSDNRHKLRRRRGPTLQVTALQRSHYRVSICPVGRVQGDST